MSDIDELFSAFTELPKQNLKRSKLSESDVEVSDARNEENTENSETEISLTPQIIELSSNNSYKHQLVLPPNQKHNPLNKPETSYKSYNFELDDFQKAAISCIDNNQSVLVSAHTSSGKTVVAEYAISKCLANHQRVIYTSPIKALSNQKYRDLAHEFHDVGLQTGDVTLDPNASVIVMTTEILRSMLYRGSEIIREVAWVIFDEIHYMRDKERGVVWEESIILLPDTIKYVFLSATIPNALQFASWITQTHDQPVHIISTDFRAVPLNHYIYSSDSGCLYLIKDNFNLKPENIKKSLSSGGKNELKDTIKRVTKFLFEKNFSPTIFFSFSKRECEFYATLIGNFCFNTDTEKEAVKLIFESAIDGLSEEDRNLPQINSAYPLLLKGIGIHHSGLLPILKEVTELIFSQGLIKFLFATETFAMGLNMPARTVVFTSYMKYDGVENRELTAGEYVQMSGRAGRRGIDEIGTCILLGDQDLNQNIVSRIMGGTPNELLSAFRLTYNMILNLSRIEGLDPEYMMKKSFHQYQLSHHIPAITLKLRDLQSTYSNLPEISSKYTKYCKTYLKKRKYLNQMREFLSDSHIEPFLQPGRVVKIKKHKLGWGVLLSKGLKLDNSKLSISDVLIYCELDGENGYKKGGIPRVIPVDNKLLFLSAVVLIIDDFSAKKYPEILDSIKVISKNLNGIPLLEPQDYRIEDPVYKDLFEKYMNAKIFLKNSKIRRNIEETKDELETGFLRLRLKDEIKAIKRELTDVRSIVQLADLKSRKAILMSLGYINEDGSVELKGKVACEISTADELVLTELFFNGFFKDLDDVEICAALSCFLYQEKSMPDSGSLSDANTKSYRIIKETAEKIVKVSKKCGLEMDYDSYIASFKSDLMNTFSWWAKGSKFASICSQTQVFEGTIIRCLRRCDELFKELIKASRCIGSLELEKKFKSANMKIKRNIAFSSSLYI